VAADAKAIATVHVRSWQTAYRGLLPQDYLDDLDPARSQPQWETIIAASDWPRRGVLVLTARAHGPNVGDPDVGGPDVGGPDVGGPGDDGVIGFAGLGPSRDEDHGGPGADVGELQTLYLVPGRWRGGAGSVLLGAVVEQLRRAGFTEATCWVLETNAGARRFYEHHGWRFDGTSQRHDWERFVVTDVRYRRPLT
jgi:GNAT superfamily N-acetyltransferase